MASAGCRQQARRVLFGPANLALELTGQVIAWAVLRGPLIDQEVLDSLIMENLEFRDEDHT